MNLECSKQYFKIIIRQYFMLFSGDTRYAGLYTAHVRCIVECDGPRRFVLARTLHVEPFQETRKQCPQQALNDVIPTTTCTVEKLRRHTSLSILSFSLPY